MMGIGAEKMAPVLNQILKNLGQQDSRINARLTIF
jgi:hypothetical protein